MLRAPLLRSSRLLSAARPTLLPRGSGLRFASSAGVPASGGSSGGQGKGGRTLLYVGLATLGASAAFYQHHTSKMSTSTKEASASASYPKTALRPDKFQPFELSKIEDISPNTRLLRFSFEHPDQKLGLKVASCLLVRAPKPGGAEDEWIIRPYTPISLEEETGHVDLAIKVYPNGAMSQHIFSLKPGDTLEMKGPIPKIPYELNKYKHIGMIAGGTGITPMIQVIRKIFSNPADQTKVSLIFGNITEADILLRDELDGLAKQYPDRFRVYYTLDKPPKGWKAGTGFVTDKMISERFPKPGTGNLVTVCGPPGMVSHLSGLKESPAVQGKLTGVLKKLGYMEEEVFKF